MKMEKPHVAHTPKNTSDDHYYPLTLYILDTSAFLNNFLSFLDEHIEPPPPPTQHKHIKLITTPQVLNELRNYALKQLVTSVLIPQQRLTVMEPSALYLKKLETYLMQQGYSKFQQLSEADLSILTLAIELHHSTTSPQLPQNNNLVIVSDDYALQNAAYLLHISVQGSHPQNEITKIKKWSYKCQFCRKTFKNISNIQLSTVSTKKPPKNKSKSNSKNTVKSKFNTPILECPECGGPLKPIIKKQYRKNSNKKRKLHQK